MSEKDFNKITSIIFLIHRFLEWVDCLSQLHNDNVSHISL